MGKILAAALVAAMLSGCVHSSVIPLSANTIEISISAALFCGSTGAQNSAVRHAAAETLRRGYDRFIILGGEYQNTAQVIATTPIESQTNSVGSAQINGNMITGSSSSTTTTSGGFPIIVGHHHQSITIRMFKEQDFQSGNAIDARYELGPDWQSKISSSDNTCL